MSTTRTAVVFDIGGTLFDETTGMVSQTRAALEGTIGRERADQFASRWQEQFGNLLAEATNGDRPWAHTEAFRNEALASLLVEEGFAADGPEYEALADVGNRLSPFDDVAPGLDELSRVAHVIGLTNTDFAAASAGSAGAGFRWHALLSTELAKTFKPNPEAYRLAEDLLGIDPAQSLFVAAHPWDLRAAAEHGYRTVYLPRPHTIHDAKDGEFDHVVHTVGEIAAIAEQQ